MGVSNLAPSMNRTVISSIYVAGESVKYFPEASYKISEVPNVAGTDYKALRVEDLDAEAQNKEGNVIDTKKLFRIEAKVTVANELLT